MNITSLGVPPPATPTATEDIRTHAQISQTRALAQAVQRVNAALVLPDNQQLSVSLDPQSKSPVVKFTDTNTNEVIDQVPAEYVLRLADYLESQQAQEQATQEIRP
jgi:uncharacterized FlaG/YvyC family protein